MKKKFIRVLLLFPLVSIVLLSGIEASATRISEWPEDEVGQVLGEINERQNQTPSNEKNSNATGNVAGGIQSVNTTLPNTGETLNTYATIGGLVVLLLAIALRLKFRHNEEK